MITMQLTPQDIADAKKVIDAADLDGPQAKMLYDALYRAQAKVGTTYEMVPAARRSGRRPLWGLRAARKQLDRGQT
jgi:hypothetical protein